MYRQRIIRTAVHVTSYEDATQQIVDWALVGSARIVCAANVHMVMEAFDSPQYQQIINDADLVTPDGMPLVWAMRLLGVSAQERVYGPTLTLCVCEEAASNGIPVALYGGSEESLADFCFFLYHRFPNITVACKIAPPFRELTIAEDDEYTNLLVDSGAKIIFVGIGCPKQERWMAAHKSRIPAVMIGVGAAFDFYSGRTLQAPAFLQKCGLEWLFRLCMEPRRLWKRYLKHNLRFVLLFFLQWLRHLCSVHR